MNDNEYKYEVIDAILDQYEVEQDAFDYARGICDDWTTTHTDTLPKYNNHIGTVEGIDVYYDYGADYYFFVVAD